MPLYDFKCSTCKIIFEKIVKNSLEKVKCDCGAKAKIVFNPTSNFHLKGNCWAKDRYTKIETKGDKK